MSTYDHIRCPIYFISWSEHSPDCPRHDYRPGAKSEAEATTVPDPGTGMAAEIDRLRAALDRIAAEAVVPIAGRLDRWEWAVGRICSCTYSTRDEARAGFRRRFGMEREGD
jgi:hypothetical protein